MAAKPKKTVLITGCSTGGIGWAMAQEFHHQGYHVFATARNPSKITGLSELSDTDILELDVTIPQTIQHCKEHVATRTGGTLDVLVNNAGIEFNSPLLDTDIAAAKKLYDVNVWGPLAMIQAFAPLLLESKGLIFNQSSIDGSLNMVWAGIFSSSKSALTHLSLTLHHELAPLQIRVLTSISGSANTPMFPKPGGAMQLPASSHYHGIEDVAWKERLEHQGQATDVHVLARGLVGDVVGGKGGVVWRGAWAGTVWWVGWGHLGWVVDWVVNGARGVGRVGRARAGIVD